MGNTKLTIGILVWNGEKYLPALFESLKKQTWQDFEIIVVDNASSDGSKEILRFAQDDRQWMRLVHNPTNVGFTAGHNQIFALSQSPYHLVLNQDIYLEPDCLEKLVGFMDARVDAAAVGPKLLKWAPTPSALRATPPCLPAGRLEAGGDNIDSLGLKVLRSRRVIDIKRPISYQLKAKSSEEVFGVSGACALYRRGAIESIGGLFDENFFAYKEDVDLAYRIASAGGKSFVLSDAVGYHNRTGADSGQASDYAQAQNKTNQSRSIKYYSYRNHLITLFKNEYWQNLIIDLPWILWYELKKFGYFLLFDRAVLAGLEDIWHRRQGIKKQRARIKKLRKLDWKEMRKIIYA